MAEIMLLIKKIAENIREQWNWNKKCVEMYMEEL